MRRLRDMERAVMPGFYGGGADGRIHTLPRGGSDISGALLASASGSDAYENWTDVARHLPRRSRNRAQRKGDSCHGL